jgi:hypothetical protein
MATASRRHSSDAGKEQVVDPRWLSPSGQELNRLTETLVNLMYLIRFESHDSEKVHFYVDLAEQSLERIRAIVQENVSDFPRN